MYALFFLRQMIEAQARIGDLYRPQPTMQISNVEEPAVRTRSRSRLHTNKTVLSTRVNQRHSPRRGLYRNN